MLKQIVKQWKVLSMRKFSTSGQKNFRVAVCGASGGIGQPLSLLLKRNPLVTELRLYDIVHTPGVVADLSHIDTNTKVCGYMGPDQICDALECNHKILQIESYDNREPKVSDTSVFNLLNYKNYENN
uniref:Malate dehydrogenase, mitochondrial n=1 Tax=Glossina brevipalpis TaxID=37001 RepID=A0A1A9X227_9MUSC